MFRVVKCVLNQVAGLVGEKRPFFKGKVSPFFFFFFLPKHFHCLDGDSSTYSSLCKSGLEVVYQLRTALEIFNLIPRQKRSICSIGMFVVRITCELAADVGGQ